jgi:hypothetical protein
MFEHGNQTATSRASDPIAANAMAAGSGTGTNVGMGYGELTQLDAA